MWVYKSIYNVIAKPEILTKHIYNNNDIENEILFKIWIIPQNVEIYNLFKDEKNFSSISLNITNCSIFIQSDISFSSTILSDIELYISHNIPKVYNIPPSVSISPIGVVENPTNAVYINGNINMFYPTHTNDVFTYYNYKNNNALKIDIYDTLVCYKTLRDRKAFVNMCGKVMLNKKVALFNLYPMKYGNIVYILPEEFYILPESNNKIAIVMIQNFTFWLVTKNHTFINNNNNPIEINSSFFCITTLKNSTIKDIYNVFKNYNFTNIKNTSKCFYSEEEDLMFFMGVYDLKNSFKYTKCFSQLFN